MKYTLVLLLLAFGVADAVKWVATNSDKKTCVIFAAETVNVKLNIQNGDNVTEEFSFAINETQKVTGNCNDKLGENPAQSIEVTFFPEGKLPASAVDAQTWSLKLWFTKPEANTAFKLADYQMRTAPMEKYNSTTQVFTKSSTAELDAHASGTNGYKCSTSGLSLASDVQGTPDSTIELRETKMIAQAMLDTADFPPNQAFEQCALDSKTSDIVPIVVGACLAGLVAVVLVAYLVGRARAKRQGYASV